MLLLVLRIQFFPSTSMKLIKHQIIYILLYNKYKYNCLELFAETYRLPSRAQLAPGSSLWQSATSRPGRRSPAAAWVRVDQP